MKKEEKGIIIFTKYLNPWPGPQCVPETSTSRLPVEMETQSSPAPMVELVMLMKEEL